MAHPLIYRSQARHRNAVGPVTYNTGQIGQSLGLSNDGNSSPANGQYVNAGTESAFQFGAGQDFSVSLWVNTTDYVNGGDRSDTPFISNKNWASFSTTGWVIAGRAGGGGGWEWNFDTDQASNNRFTAGPTIDDGNWHHIAVIHDRDANATFYQDGIEVGAVSIAAHNNGSLDAGLPTVCRDRWAVWQWLQGLLQRWVGRCGDVGPHA